MNLPTFQGSGDAVSFPILDRCCYLNHATISPWPAVVADAVAVFVEDNRRNGPLNYADWLDVEARARQRMARLLGAREADLAFTGNTSQGLNLIAMGLDWAPGDEVVFPAGEFPSNVLPWRELTTQGVRPVEVPLDAEAPEAALVEALTPRTRLMSVSSVQYATGLRLNLETLGLACRERGVLLCVDAIQQLGCLDLDTARLPVDFVVSGTHKWLLAGEGLGIFWSRPEAREQLRRGPAGWRAYPDPFVFERTDWTLPAEARRFEPGTLNTLGLHALDAALGLLLDKGMATVEGRIHDSVEFLRQSLEGMSGMGPISPKTAATRSGIVNFSPASGEVAGLFEALQIAGVSVACRGQGIRLSPHFYTPRDQLVFALEVIERYLKRRG